MFGPVLLNKDDWVRRLGPFRFQFWACMLIGPLTYKMRSVGLLGSGPEPMVPTVLIKKKYIALALAKLEKCDNKGKIKKKFLLQWGQCNKKV